MSYLVLKQIHLAAVGVSLGLFVLRGWWMLRGSRLLGMRWVRILPHVNDTILFAAGIGLAYVLRQIPGHSPWLTAKLIALALYIALGTVALKRGRTPRVRAAAWIAALCVFGYIVAVALTKSPLPWRTG